MSFAYTRAAEALGKADLDLDTIHLRAFLVMSNTTADTERGANVVDDFTTLDEYDGAAYVRKTLAGVTLTRNDTDHRIELAADPIVWTALGIGTRQCVGVVVYAFVTDDTDSIPLAFVNGTGFPFDGGGSTVTVTPNAAGIVQITT